MRDAMAKTHTGTCFCGAVEIEVTGEPLEMGYCHCRSCRAYSGAPVVAFTLWPPERVRVTRGADRLGRFNKTGTSERCFCTTCGGHVLSNHPDWELVDVLAEILPDLPFAPSVHLNYAERVLPIRDGLRKLKDFPAKGGGSGEVVAE